MSDIIKISNLNYQKMFENLSLTIEDNQFATITGPNSCGKTTLIRILNRDIITDDSISILGKNINDYKISEYTNIVQCIFPLEIEFLEDTVKEELYYYKDLKNLNTIIKKLKLDKFYKKDIEELSKKEIVLSQITIALANNPKILLIDNLNSVFSIKEINDIFKFLKEYSVENPLTLINFTVNLEESLNCDYIYIINDKKVVLEGETLKVLQRDNIINKIGLNLPFMIDLSVKLKDYDLIDDIELEVDRMVDLLWK